MKIDLLNANAVHDFSNGSVAVYVSNTQLNCPETIVNLNVIDAPAGIYTLRILPATAVENGTQEHFYNLRVSTEFAQQQHENDGVDHTPTGKANKKNETTPKLICTHQLQRFDANKCQRNK